MTETLLERILYLISKGFEVRIRPDFKDGCIEIRLTKDQDTIARVVDPKACNQAYAFKSDEDWFMYNLLWLEMEYESYTKRFREENNHE